MKPILISGAGIPASRIENIVRTNKHYDAYGLIGNSNILRWILGRPPTNFAEFMKRDLI